MNFDTTVIDWLLEKDNPSVRYRTLTELLDRSPDDTEVIEARQEMASSPAVTRLMSLMYPDGYWQTYNKSRQIYIGDGVDYTDFNTTHFCLAYLSELGATRDNPDIEKAANRYLNLQQEDGDFLRHFSCLYSFNIRTFIRLGFRNDPRLQKTIDLMLGTERHDGGYLCDMHEGKHKNKPVKSCIRGTVKALLAFAELPEYHDHPRCKQLIEYFLNRDCLFRTTDLTQPVNGGVMITRFPITWRTSITEITWGLSKLGCGKDEHMKRAWDVLETKKDPEGKYILDWTPTQVQKLFKIGKRSQPNKWVTLYALLSRKEAGI